MMYKIGTEQLSGQTCKVDSQFLTYNMFFINFVLSMADVSKLVSVTS